MTADVRWTQASPYFGSSLGSLKDSLGQVVAEVWLVNQTAIQLTESAIPEGHRLVLESPVGVLKPLDRLFLVHGDGQRGFSTPITHLTALDGNARLLAIVPDGVAIHNNLVLYDQEAKRIVSSVSLKQRELEPFCCIHSPGNRSKGIIGNHYNVSTGPIFILDSKTFLLPAFAFEGTRAPDGWIFAGTGDVKQENGHKLQVLGRDEQIHCALHEHYDGTTDIIARLPGQLTVYDIQWLSVFCYQYNVDFGHVELNLKAEKVFMPAHVPAVGLEPHALPAQCD